MIGLYSNRASASLIGPELYPECAAEPVNSMTDQPEQGPTAATALESDRIPRRRTVDE